MSPEPGWYHAQGDPPGTVRRWNGEAWIGFAIDAPRADGETTASNQGVGVKAFAPVPGQTKLQVMAILAQLALLPLAGSLLFQAFAAFRTARSNRVAVANALNEGGGTDQYGLASLLSGLSGMLAGVIFLVWFFLAYRNISLWSITRRSLMWAVFAWIVPFINLIRPMSMMLELAERSPRSDRAGSISPVPVVAWWLLWMLPGFAIFFGVIAAVRQVMATGSGENFGPTLLTLIAIASLLNAISALIAIYLVQMITDHQDARLRPTSAQLAMLQRDAETEAFRQNQPGSEPG